MRSKYFWPAFVENHTILRTQKVDTLLTNFTAKIDLDAQKCRHGIFLYLTFAAVHKFCACQCLDEKFS